MSRQLHAPVALSRWERASGTLWVGGRVGPKTGMDDVEKRKISSWRESNPGRPTRRYTDSPEVLFSVTLSVSLGDPIACLKEVRQSDVCRQAEVPKVFCLET